jgi:hypothetical protein
MKKLIIVLIALFLCSCSKLQAKQEEEPNLVTITGRVYYMGSEPMTSIGLNTFNGGTLSVFAEKRVMDEIAGLQNSLITVKGYIDTAIKYPQKSIHVKEFKKLEAVFLSGKVLKSGMGGLARYYLQTKDKTYNIITEKIIEIGNFKGNMVQLKGYVFEAADAVDNVYLLWIKKVKE